MTGLVIKNTGSHYIVLTEDGVERPCLAKGNLRLRGFRSTNPIVVGDHVVVEQTSGQAEEETLYTILREDDVVATCVLDD